MNERLSPKQTDEVSAARRIVDPSELRRIGDILGPTPKESASAIYTRGVEAGKRASARRTRRLTRTAAAAGVLAGAVGGVAGTNAVEAYQENHEHHVVYQEITPGLASGETPTQAVADAVQRYIDQQDIDQGKFPSNDVHVAAMDAAGQWKDLAEKDYVDTGAQFEVTVLANEAGDLDVNAEAVDPN